MRGHPTINDNANECAMLIITIIIVSLSMLLHALTLLFRRLSRSLTMNRPFGIPYSSRLTRDHEKPVVVPSHADQRIVWLELAWRIRASLEQHRIDACMSLSHHTSDHRSYFVIEQT
jgi:hypothetical protein